MQFLEANESSLLHSILVAHLLIAHETARSDMLVNCGLESLLITLSSLEGSAALFVNELCATLSQSLLITQPSGQPGLVALLDYLSLPPYDVDLSPEEKKFLDRVKKKCLQWYASRLQQLSIVDKSRTRIDQNDLLLLRARNSPIINRDQLIVNYGFYSLMADFADQVNYGTATGFTIEGDFSVLKGYILERMRRNLMERVPGPQKVLEISFDPGDTVESNDALMKKVLSRNSCSTLTDLIRAFPRTHILLVIWCYAVPSQQLEIEALHFWNEVEQSVLPLVQTQHQCFVLILANVTPGSPSFQVDKFTPLQIPPSFEMTDLIPWIRGRLEYLDIEQNDIKFCLDRLNDQRGDIPRTYHELEYIVSYLQEKYAR